MKCDYSGRAQSDGRVYCEKCKRGMLGIDEQDPRQGWFTSIAFDTMFCDCPSVPKKEAGISECDEMKKELADLRASFLAYLSDHCACCRRGNFEKERDEKAKEALKS